MSKEEVLNLVKKASEAANHKMPENAQLYAQAAYNAAQALQIIALLEQDGHFNKC